jgi:hypothetical protein
MKFAVNCLISVLWVSYALFADPISRPTTTAAIRPMTPVPSLTTSFVSASSARTRSSGSASRDVMGLGVGARGADEYPCRI